MKHPTKSYSLLRRPCKPGQWNWHQEGKLSRGKDPKRHIPGRCTITITICNRHNATQPHPYEIHSRFTNSLNCRKRSNTWCTWTTLKLFAKNEKELETLIQTVRICSQDIGMEFGKEKCAMLVMKSGKRHMMKGVELPNQVVIRTLGEKETYKYLGILETDTIKQKEMKEKKN